ncbi:hypothetical protein [Streptomyces sp. MK5]|uniref:hypothetical protein n=1 Tax=Streptomyces sp. MK5 TaxID=3064253 RepID=UPI002741997E|nr:hypothetical protein [Streptomyces sp. MK5]
MGADIYDDGTILCDDQGITIRRYYPWGAKRIPYASVKGVKTLPLTGANKVRRWRIWGSGDFVHWWNFDPHRPKKEVALVLDVGRRVRPTITPDDPATVARIITDKGQQQWDRMSPR